MISIVIITKNEENMIGTCLETLDFGDEIIIVDNNSTDNTIRIAKNYDVKIIEKVEGSFSDLRNRGLKEAQGKWILYIDADERVTENLKKEILFVTRQNKSEYYCITRKNYFLNTPMYSDQVSRLFPKSCLEKWVGEVHESPVVNCNQKLLQNHLLHYSHRSIVTMLEKTNNWTSIEAQLRYQNNHPEVKIWRIIRIALTQFYHQFISKKVFKFGKAGIIEGYFQIIDKIIIYTKLWELQQK